MSIEEADDDDDELEDRDLVVMDDIDLVRGFKYPVGLGGPALSLLACFASISRQDRESSAANRPRVIIKLSPNSFVMKR